MIKEKLRCLLSRKNNSVRMESSKKPINESIHNGVTQQINANKLWNIKYSIALEIARESYNIHNERLRNTDEKINKYLIFLTILIAGFTTLISSSTIDSLQINFTKSIPLSVLSILCISFTLVSLSYLFYILTICLKCLNLVESRKMALATQILDETTNDDEITFKDNLIKRYDLATTSTHEAVEKKLENIVKMAAHLYKCIFLLIISFILIFSTRVYEKNMVNDDKQKNSRPISTSPIFSTPLDKARSQESKLSETKPRPVSNSNQSSHMIANDEMPKALIRNKK